MAVFDQDILDTQAWFATPRFAGITRLHSARQVVEQRGTMRATTRSRKAAAAFHARLRELFAEPRSITTFRPCSSRQARGDQAVEMLRFISPGSETLIAGNVVSLRTHRIEVWGKPSIVARTDISVTRAVDRIKYTEAGARYDSMDLMAGGRGERLPDDELRSIKHAFGVQTELV
jgi:hypothetical protein